MTTLFPELEAVTTGRTLASVRYSQLLAGAASSDPTESQRAAEQLVAEDEWPTVEVALAQARLYRAQQEANQQQ
jgi:hypothetical protein